MPHARRSIVTSSLLIALLDPTPVHAALRVPQIPICGDALQALLDSMGSNLNVFTDQLDDPMRDWAPGSDSPDASAWWCMQIEARRDPGIRFGIYDASAGTDPQMIEVLPAGSAPGSNAFITLSGGTCRVAWFDPAGVYMGQQTTTCAPGLVHHVGFYARLGDVTRYSQDLRDDGHAADLTYPGTLGVLGSAAWDCFDLDLSPACVDFDDAVIQTFPLGDLPTRVSSWGAVKTRSW
jgi:hypothetical protein